MDCLSGLVIRREEKVGQKKRLIERLKDIEIGKK
jgi:hypothetical protein